MAAGTEAYVDTSALIAFADRSDSHHLLFRRLFADPLPAITTVLVVTEGHAWFLRRYDRARALQFLAMLEEMSFLQVLAVGPAELRAAADLLRRYSDQRLTLMDAVGLHVMKAHGVGTCWSTDHHLGLTGVQLAMHHQ